MSNKAKNRWSKKIETGPLLKDGLEPFICHFASEFSKNVKDSGFLKLICPKNEGSKEYKEGYRKAVVGTGPP